jgi:hypothetical protein
MKHACIVAAALASLEVTACSNPPTLAPAAQSAPAASEAQAAASDPVADSAPDASQPKSDDVTAVLARERAWLGGAEALKALHDVTLTGAFTAGSIHGRTRMMASAAGYWSYFSSVDNKTVWVQGIDERGAWNFDAGGNVRALSDEDSQGMHFQMAHLLSWHLDDRHGFAPTYMGRTSLDGVECDRVRLLDRGQDGSADEMIALDGAPLALCITRAGVENRTRFSDWRDVQGCRFPFHEEEDGAQEISITWEKIESNRDLGADAFERPDDIETWHPVLEKDLTVPMELLLDTYVIVHGAVNGTPIDILVDSGCSYPVLDPSFAKSLGLVATGKMGFHGTGNDAEGEFARDVSIDIGPLKLPRQRVAVIDLGMFRERTGRDLSAIVGVTLFAHLPVTIDYAARHIEIHDPRRFEAPAGSVTVPARAAEYGLLMVEAQLEDLAPEWFMVDSGTGRGVTFSRPYSLAKDLLSRHPQHVQVPGVGLGGTHFEEIAVFDAFTWAGHAFHDVPCTMPTGDGGMAGSKTFAGTIGAGILARFVVTFDLPRHRLLLESGRSLDDPFEKDKLGIMPRVVGDKVMVDVVVPGTPAAAAGLVSGLELTKVDGVAGNPARMIERLVQTRSMEPGTKVRIGLSDGREIFVVLAEYY